MLKWEQIGKTYGRRRLFGALNGQLATGAGLVVTGANGAGKSTLLKVLAGLVRPDTGTVERRCQQSQIGYCAPDQLFYPEFTALDNLRFACDIRCLKPSPLELQNQLISVGIGKSANKTVGTFSTGMVQRLRIATALAIGKSVLIFDEPTIGLDSDGRELVENLIIESAQAGEGNVKSIIVATNEPAQALKFASLGWETLHVGE